LCHNKHRHDFFHNICDFNGFNSYFHVNSTLMTHCESQREGQNQMNTLIVYNNFSEIHAFEEVLHESLNWPFVVVPQDYQNVLEVAFDFETVVEFVLK